MSNDQGHTHAVAKPNRRRILGLAFVVAALMAFLRWSVPISEPPPPSKDLPVITNSIGMKLALIPAGEFLMGSLDSVGHGSMNVKPQHRVRITQPFYLGVYEQTQTGV